MSKVERIIGAEFSLKLKHFLSKFVEVVDCKITQDDQVIVVVSNGRFTWKETISNWRAPLEEWDIAV